MTLVTSDVEGWHDFLVGKGVEFVRAPAQSDEFGVFSSLFMSPHGYRIEVQRFNDDLWHTRQLDA